VIFGPLCYVVALLKSEFFFDKFRDAEYTRVADVIEHFDCPALLRLRRSGLSDPAHLRLR
jgi:hypothetical protein